MIFVTMKKGTTESDNGFQCRVKTNTTTLTLAGGKHHMWNPNKVKCTSNNSDEYKKKEIETLIDSYLAIHLI